MRQAHKGATRHIRTNQAVAIDPIDNTSDAAPHKGTDRLLTFAELPKRETLEAKRDTARATAQRSIAHAR